MSRKTIARYDDIPPEAIARLRELTNALLMDREIATEMGLSIAHLRAIRYRHLIFRSEQDRRLLRAKPVPQVVDSYSQTDFEANVRLGTRALLDRICATGRLHSNNRVREAAI
jgi:hypothetical protein